MVFENVSLTYQELDHRSNRLANVLAKAGVKSETLVGLSLHNSLDLLVGILAILKSGGTYLPLDPSYPRERINTMLEHARPVLLLTESSCSGQFIHSQCKIIEIDQDWHAEETLRTPVEPHHLAYVIYTSGSTGKPKGIMVEHGSFAHAALAHREYYPATMIALMASGISFDPSLLIICHTLAAGGTICLPSREAAADPDKIIDLIENHAVNYLLCVPSFYTMILKKSRKLLSLRTVSLAGENIPNSLPALHADLAPHAILFNEYGPTEYAIGTTIAKIYDPDLRKIHKMTIGNPLPNTQVYILDEKYRVSQPGIKGEIYIGGLGLARGYLNSQELTDEKFIRLLLPEHQSPVLLYRSGDFGAFLPNGDIEFLGRIDHQVKIRGHRIELGEIEHAVCQYMNIDEAVVIVLEDDDKRKRLAVYFSSLNDTPITDSLRSHLNRVLPKYMVPSALLQVNQWPRTPNGKIDRTSLPPMIPRATQKASFAIPSTSELQQAIFLIWKQILQQEQFGIHDNFFDLGGDSLQVAEIQTELQDKLGLKISMVELFQFPTISQLANHFDPEKERLIPNVTQKSAFMENAIAVIGMSGRFPGADDIHSFWENLCQGKETIALFSDAELAAAGIPASKFKSPHYVKARGILHGIEDFDADFFEMTAREAQLTDPQHRVFLECVSDALENAGYCPDRYNGLIGVYGGTSRSTYFLHHLFPNQHLMEIFGNDLIRIGNEPDFLTTRVSYKLNLKGPSLAIQTACSTSLAAVCVACNHLLSHQCDMAVAGGVSISLPQISGYMHRQGMIFSPDGHCKPFDASAQGTVSSNGAGVVVLKRLQDAHLDRDSIYAVIRGYGMNNDGALKIGYSAPSVQGQADAIRSAIAMSGIDPATISYVEAHGTGTPLGDPIEIEALSKAFQQHTQKKGYCALGSIKSNIGHLMEAAGIAGLIKTVLSLQQKILPPTLHFNTPNPHINFKNSPFYPQTQLTKWPSDSASLRRACVSSFGIGGTNAHVILEETPKSIFISEPSPYLLIFSAKTPSALKAMATNLAKYLQQYPEISLTDVAYTLQMGRREFKYKKVLVCCSREEAITNLLAFDLEQKISDYPILNHYAQLWMSGASCDWMDLYKQEKPRRIPLPTYPFEKKRYWIDPPSIPQRETNKPCPSLEEGYKEGPSKTIEMEMLAIWKELLGAKTIGIHDDFFMLGGDSLLALQILSKIEAEFGAPLSLRTFYEGPTVAKLVNAISQVSNLVKLKPGTVGHPPLFVVHAIDGNLFSYKSLAKSMTFKGPIFGIQTTDSECCKTIEEMASSYIHKLQKIQSEGPYFLFGSSFGGLIAYEMARQLKASKQQIAFLGMHDIIHPEHSSLRGKSDSEMIASLIELFESKEITVDRLQQLSPQDLDKRLVASMRLNIIPLNAQQKILDQIKRHLAAITTYSPKSYEGRIIFFEMRERFFRHRDFSLGSTWKDLVQDGLDVIELEGNHANMMHSHQVADLARHLDAYLD